MVLRCCRTQNTPATATAAAHNVSSQNPRPNQAVAEPANAAMPRTSRKNVPVTSSATTSTNPAASQTR